MRVLSQGQASAHGPEIDIFHYDHIIPGYQFGTQFLQIIMPLMFDLCVKLLYLSPGFLVVFSILFFPAYAFLQSDQLLLGSSVVFRVVGFPALTIYIEIFLRIVQSQKTGSFWKRLLLRCRLPVIHFHQARIRITDTDLISPVCIHEYRCI